MNFSRNTKYRQGQVAKHKRNKKVFALNKAKKEKMKKDKSKASSKDGPKGTRNE
jgi:hypothetical protein